MGISIAVGAVDCKIISTTPHSSWTESHVKSFFTGVDQIRCSIPRAMIQVLCLNIRSVDVLFMAYMFQFMCKYLPEKLILNSLDL
jgi:hypothetical protein